MRKRKKVVIAVGGGLALLVAGAGIALAQQNRGPGAADLNGDGQITSQEIESAARNRFAEADSNKDGKLTGDEIPRRRHGGGGRHGRHFDGGPAPFKGQDQSGQPARRGPPPGVARTPMDADGDGAVTFPEFYRKFRERMLRADTNGDGTVSAEERAQARAHRRGDQRQ